MRNNNSLFIEPTNITEVTNKIIGLKEKVDGVDRINANILKELYYYIAQPLVLCLL